MAFSFIASAIAQNDAGSATTLDCTSSLNLNTGDVVVAISAWEGSTTSTVAETGGGNSLTMATLQNDGSNWLQFAYSLSTTANATSTFRQTLAAGQVIRRILVLQFRPTAGSTVSLDAGPSNGSGNGTAITSGNITTTGTDEIVCGGMNAFDYSTTISNRNIGGSAADGSAVDAVANKLICCISYKIYSSTQTNINAQFTTSASNLWLGQIIGFKAIVAASADTVIPRRSLLINVPI